MVSFSLYGYKFITVWPIPKFVLFSSTLGHDTTDDVIAAADWYIYIIHR